MSNSPAEQTSEKSNFTRKCSLLSQYLKKKGSFGDISLELARKPEFNLGFAGKLELKGHENGKFKGESPTVKTLDFSQKLSSAGGGPSKSSGGKAKDADLSEPATVPEAGNSQLTIFFNGKVIVYDEFPVGKAKEIMEMAKQANPSVSEGIPVTVSPNSAAEDNDNKENNNSKVNGNALIPDLNEPSSSGNTNGDQTTQNQLVERIARRASLHRFFAKRKERAVVRAPYQVNQNAGRHLPNPKEGSPQLEQGQSSRQVKGEDGMAALRSEGQTEKTQEEKEEDVTMKDLELRL